MQDAIRQSLSILGRDSEAVELLKGHSGPHAVEEPKVVDAPSSVAAEGGLVHSPGGSRRGLGPRCSQWEGGKLGLARKQGEGGIWRRHGEEHYGFPSP